MLCWDMVYTFNKCEPYFFLLFFGIIYRSQLFIMYGYDNTPTCTFLSPCRGIFCFRIRKDIFLEIVDISYLNLLHNH